MGSLQPWEQIVSQKRSLRDKLLEPYLANDVDQRVPQVASVQARSCVKGDPEIQEITDIDSIPRLFELLKSGQYTAEQTTLAYIKRYADNLIYTGRLIHQLLAKLFNSRAVISHQLVRNSPIICLLIISTLTKANRQTNCLTEVVFEEALKEARQLDHDFQQTGQVKGPLHGIPVTLKDQFDIKGVDTTLGYVGRSFAPATEDAVLVQMLKDMGAIVLAKTNLPQSIMVRIPRARRIRVQVFY